MSVRGAFAALALGLMASTAQRAGAQEIDLRGKVVDAGSGVAIEGVVVRVEGPTTGVGISGARGEWRIPHLSAGSFRITTQRIGFAPVDATLTLPLTDDLVLRLETAVLPLDAVVVTASRRMQRLADVPVTTELISRAEIQRAGVADLSTVLVERTGIQLESGLVNGEGVVLQGLGSERILVLVDGQPLEGRINGQVDLSRIPTSIVERVEVVKGPQSSLYGSEAMGGVVNVITRGASPESWALDLDLTAGSQARTEGAVTLSGTRRALGYTVSGGRRRTELTPGRSDTRGALADRWDGMAKLVWAPSESLRVHGSALFDDERQRWQSGPLYQFADNVEVSAQVGADWTSGAHRIAPLMHFTRFDHLARGASQPKPVAGTGEEESQREIEAEIVYGLTAATVALDAGVEAKQEYTVSGRVLDGERTLYTVEPFAQMTWTAGPFRVVPGARLTWSEQWGSHVSPRLAALYRPTPALAVRASVGQGFRAPAFKELYITFLNVGPGYAYTVRGNPELGPEESTNLTAGLEWTIGRGFVRGQLYHNHFDRFIESTFVGDSSGVSVYSYGNVVDGFTRGLEVEAAGVHGPLTLEASYTYLDAREGETDLRLLERPRHSARATLDYALRFGMRAAVTGNYTGSTPIQRTEEATLVRSRFLRFDARVSQRLPRGLEIALGARNVLNDMPTYWPGFTGRQLYATVGWNVAAKSE